MPSDNKQVDSDCGNATPLLTLANHIPCIIPLHEYNLKVGMCPNPSSQVPIVTEWVYTNPTHGLANLYTPTALSMVCPVIKTRICYMCIVQSIIIL